MSEWIPPLILALIIVGSGAIMWVAIWRATPRGMSDAVLNREAASFKAQLDTHMDMRISMERTHPALSAKYNDDWGATLLSHYRKLEREQKRRAAQ